MRGLTAATLLGVYERGLAATTAQRAQLVLEAASGDVPVDGLAALTVGERNRLLLRVWEMTFGPHLGGVAACPGCGDHLETAFSIGDLHGGGRPAGDPTSRQRMQVADLETSFRLPTATDMALIEASPDARAARRTLIERCVQVRQAGRRRSPTRLPSSVIEQVSAAMLVVDPDLLTDLELSCPSCGKRQTLAFDIAAFLWEEIAARAPRLLLEVHELAAAYGWHEADILGLSPWRRNAYLTLAGA